MRTRIMGLFTLASMAWASLLVPAMGQSEGPEFAAPQRLKAGDAYLGAKRLYPSPVIQDVDGDGVGDVVIGDLMGKLTYANREIGDEGVTGFGRERPLKDRAGEGVKFHNW